MVKRLKNIITRILIKLIDVSVLEHTLNEHHIKTHSNSLKLGENSLLLVEGRIENLANNPNLIRVGKGSIIKGTLLVWPYSKGISIGDNCFIGQNTQIWSGSNISIGNNVLISHNVNIIDSNSHELDPVERNESFKKLLQFGHPQSAGNVETAPIIIEDDVWVSFDTSILKGVNIGRGSIIGAGSVITKDIPSYCLYAGNPARFIKKLNE